jgi:hypothetical protein
MQRNVGGVYRVDDRPDALGSGRLAPIDRPEELRASPTVDVEALRTEYAGWKVCG